MTCITIIQSLKHMLFFRVAIVPAVVACTTALVTMVCSCACLCCALSFLTIAILRFFVKCRTAAFVKLQQLVEVFV